MQGTVNVPGASASDLAAVQKIADTAMKTATRENLIINWYFPAASVIDQRCGYLVPPDTPYYSDTGLTTQAGTVSAYTTAVYVNGTYGTITVSRTTYYVDWGAAVRGYVNHAVSPTLPTIDTWRMSRSSLLLTEQGIALTPTTASVNHDGWVGFFDENAAQFVGKVVTVSALTANNQLISATGTAPSRGGAGVVSEIVDNTKIFFGWVWLYSIPSVELWTVNNATATFVAVKLELGDTQTLAHQDENGNWVLNDPPPDPAEELLKCQRYYQLFSSADKRPTALADYRPAMRVNPAVGTININGQTFYYADANL